MPLPQTVNYSTQGGFRTATFYSGITAGPGLTAAPALLPPARAFSFSRVPVV